MKNWIIKNSKKVLVQGPYCPVVREVSQYTSFPLKRFTTREKAREWVRSNNGFIISDVCRYA